MGLWEDLRFCRPPAVKDKWFSLVAAVALALGIGVNATVFTFVNAVLIRGLPIADPDRTMAVDSFDRVRNRGMGVSYLDYRDWRDNTKAFDAFGAYNGTVANLSDEGQPPERYNGSHLGQRVRDPRHAAGDRPRLPFRTTIVRRAVGRADRPQRVGQPLRQQPVGDRPDRSHQRQSRRRSSA